MQFVWFHLRKLKLFCDISLFPSRSSQVEWICIFCIASSPYLVLSASVSLSDVNSSLIWKMSPGSGWLLNCLRVGRFCHAHMNFSLPFSITLQVIRAQNCTHKWQTIWIKSEESWTLYYFHCWWWMKLISWLNWICESTSGAYNLMSISIRLFNLSHAVVPCFPQSPVTAHRPKITLKMKPT